MQWQSYTPQDRALLILRIALAITLIAHGYPKLFDPSPVAFARFLRLQHFPAPLLSAWFMALVEFIGGLAILAGIHMTWAGWAVAFEQALVAWFLKIGKGIAFIAARGVGWEFNFLLMAMAIALVFLGSGPITYEAILRRRRM